MANGLPVTILELSPPFRFIPLEGTAQPERPVAMPIRQRSTRTLYPGTNKASVQIMGTEDEPIILKGWFRDAVSALDIGPQSYVDTIRSVIQGGSLCSLNWGSILRTGRITRFEPEYLLDTYIRYTIEFTVDQPPESVALKAPVVVISAAVLRKSLDAAADAAAQLFAAAVVAKTISGVVS